MKRRSYLLRSLVFLGGILIWNGHINALKINSQEVQIPLGDKTFYTSPYLENRGDHLHSGIDLVKDTANTKNASVYPADSGIVLFVNNINDKNNKFKNHPLGNAVVIYHLNGYITIYGHLNLVNVEVGQNVNRDTQIGTIGDTGNSIGYHLHYELRKFEKGIENFGEAVNSKGGKVSGGLDPCGGTAENPGDPADEDVNHRESGGTGGEDSWDGEDEDGDGDPPSGSGPGGDCPDDNESSSSSNPTSISSDLKSRYYRLAAKKGKTFLLHCWN